MADEADVRLFELAKNVDTTMHQMSAELSVKTSLYLVFAAFVFSASLQLMNFSKDLHSYAAIAICGIGAVVSLLSAIALLIAALVRKYKLFPAQDMKSWMAQIDEYKREYPDASVEDRSTAILETLIETADANQIVNETRSDWVECGAWLLFAALPFLAIGGGIAVYVCLSHLS